MRKLSFDKNQRYILSFEEKHGTHNYVILSQEELEKACLKVLTTRFHEGWYRKPSVLTDLTGHPSYSHEEIQLLKGAARLAAQAELDKFNRILERFNSREAQYLELEVAVSTKDGALAYRILDDRKGFEYETMTLKLGENFND